MRNKVRLGKLEKLLGGDNKVYVIVPPSLVPKEHKDKSVVTNGDTWLTHEEFEGLNITGEVIDPFQ